ncbi:hypothetical protein [Blastopirellula marina]|nr:hypothetical protein [Blastopirellula marina]
MQLLGSRSLLGLSLITAFTILLTGCGPQPGATYAVEVLQISQKIPGAVQGWGMVMEPWFQGGAVDQENLAKAQKRGNEAMKQVRDQIYAVAVPDDPKSQEFAETIHGYADWEVDVFMKAINEVSDLAQAENPPSLQTLKKASMLLAPLEKEEKDWVKKIHSQAKALGVKIK